MSLWDRPSGVQASACSSERLSGYCPKTTSDRALIEDKLKLELLTIARSSSGHLRFGKRPNHPTPGRSSARDIPATVSPPPRARFAGCIPPRSTISSHPTFSRDHVSRDCDGRIEWTRCGAHPRGSRDKVLNQTFLPRALSSPFHVNEVRPWSWPSARSNVEHD